MTAVLAATDVFRRDPVMAFDDIQVECVSLHSSQIISTYMLACSYSSPQDWRAKYEEVR